MEDVFINSEFTAGSAQGLPFSLGFTCILLFHTTDHKRYRTYLGVAKLDLLTKCNEFRMFMQSVATALQCFGLRLKKNLFVVWGG